MARTVKPKAKALPTIEKKIEYRLGYVCKMSDGSIQAIVTIEKGGIIDEYRETVANRAEGQAFIDLILHQKFEQENKLKSKRTRGIVKTEEKKEAKKKPSGPFGGWMKNPPESCKYRKQDKEGFWVETCFCGIICQFRADCECALVLESGRKERINGVNGKGNKEQQTEV